MSRENVEVILALFDAFNRLDSDSVRDLWTTDAEWRPALGGLVEGAVYRGQEGILEFVELQAETWESIAAEPGQIRDLENRVLVEVHLTAIGRESGIPVDRTTWNVFELRDGQAAVGRVYLTLAEALEAVGLRE